MPLLEFLFTQEIIPNSDLIFQRKVIFFSEILRNCIHVCMDVCMFLHFLDKLCCALQSFIGTDLLTGLRVN